ncbi:central tail fiber J [Vibrio phage phi 3]|uniref:Tail-3 protein n=1 Tax=Vibrio phage phi 3 TaxID=1589298 RepID=A0A0B5HAV1_9CAUD|nr:central tail fiber J [Vibrio phage phi 3]AJF40894.1 tail-3 protein [Vibrio phage phi 3]
MTVLLPSGKEFLKNSSSINMAHLVELQLPGDGNSFLYYTDYRKDISFNGATYSSGRIKSIGEIRQTKELTNYELSITVTGADSVELARALQSSAYLGKIVKVTRVFLNYNDEVEYVTATGGIIYFNGRLTSMTIRDSLSLTSTSKSDIVWTASSLAGSLIRVNGRITDDASHRGLVSVSGQMVPSDSAKKLEYKTDKGFFHANKSVNVLAQYQTQEKRYKLQSKRAGGLGGLLGGKNYETVEVWETVNKELDLDINLTAKYLPVVYGAQRVGGIPVFVDTSFEDSNEVWAVYAFCEGEIEGFLDFYIDDKPIICVSPEDSQSRVCIGNKRFAGDTISVATPINGAPSSDRTAPSIHGQQYSYNDGAGIIDFWVYHGKSNQTACPVLVNRAAGPGFVIQRTSGQGPEYWDSNFKLLDTAYVVVRMNLGAERMNLPSIEAELLGRKVKTYNASGAVVSDNKTSLNFAWQTLDYLTNPIFGAGVPGEFVPVKSFYDAAVLMDAIDSSYQSSWVPYWRYLGWDAPLNSNRKIVQGSAFLDASKDIFKNLQAILSQADASLNVINGNYVYTVEAQSAPIADIHIDDIKTGTFSLTDISNTNKYNAIQASLSDPAMGWNTNTVTFFNSQYLEEDSNIENKGNFAFPFITNYYTARTRAERLLRKSRLTKEASFSLPFYFADLVPNKFITLTVPRYNWDKKQFLIEELKWSRDGSIAVVAREYSPDAFLNSPQSDGSDGQNPTLPVNVLPPTNLRYDVAPSGSPEGLQGVLVWNASLSNNVTYYSIRMTGSTEVFTVSVPAGTPPSQYSYQIMGLASGEYTFQVKAVNGLGQVSAPASITVQINPSVNLPLVPNLRLVNSFDAVDQFIGSSIQLAWDDIDSGGVTNIRYILEVLTPAGTVVRSATLLGTVKNYTYTLALNKSDYKAANSNAVGFYRELSFRIKAIGDGGAESVGWTTL